MQAVLRAYYEGIAEPSCELEPHFIDLYRLQGDRQAQDEFRAANDANHCWRLKDDPWCCKECRWNPYNGPNGELYRCLDDNQGLLEEAFRLQVSVEAGLIGGNELSSDDIEILTIMRRDQPLLEAKVRADMIAASVSRIFASPDDNQ